jgi:ATP-dependent exoDNAse (exonuclease V) beta subunit
LITGVIDRLWKDSLGWHLIDYKSDAVVGEEREKRLRHYAPQLALYRLAVSQALDIPECSIETSILFTHKTPELLPIPEIDLDATLSAIEAQ